LVNILPLCAKNLIQSPVIQDINYNIGDAQSIISINPWKMSISSCGMVSYSATLSNGKPFPAFITFSSS